MSRRKDTVKLLLVISSLRGGGAERVMSDMANYWATKGWNVTLVTFHNPQEYENYCVHPNVIREYIYYPPGINFIDKLVQNLRRIIQLRKVAVKSTPDAVLSFLTSTNVVTILATIGLPTSVVVSERIDPARHWEGPFWNYGRWLTYRLARKVVAQTPAIGEWLVKHTQASIAVIPNPLRDLPTVISSREKLIVAVGRLSSQKGFDVLIRAFFIASQSVCDWQVVIFGQGEEEKELTKLVEEMGLEDYVRFAGWTNNPEVWFGKASLVVQLSRYEGFPNVVLEAMGMGAAVITTSAATSLIEDGINGRLVGTDDVKDAARVMLELMRDDEQRQRLGYAARKVRTTYSQSTVMIQWESVLLGPDYCSNN